MVFTMLEVDANGPFFQKKKAIPCYSYESKEIIPSRDYNNNHTISGSDLQNIPNSPKPKEREYTRLEKPKILASQELQNRTRTSIIRSHALQIVSISRAQVAYPRRHHTDRLIVNSSINKKQSQSHKESNQGDQVPYRNSKRAANFFLQ